MSFYESLFPQENDPEWITARNNMRENAVNVKEEEVTNTASDGGEANPTPFNLPRTRYFPTSRPSEIEFAAEPSDATPAPHPLASPPAFSLAARTEGRITVPFGTDAVYTTDFDAAVISGMDKGDFPPPATSSEGQTPQDRYTYEYGATQVSASTSRVLMPLHTKLRLHEVISQGGTSRLCPAEVVLYKDGKEVETVNGLTARITGVSWLSNHAPSSGNEISPEHTHTPVVVVDPHKRVYTVQMDQDGARLPMKESLKDTVRNIPIARYTDDWTSHGDMLDCSTRALVKEYPTLNVGSYAKWGPNAGEGIPLSFIGPSTEFEVDCNNHLTMTTERHRPLYQSSKRYDFGRLYTTSGEWKLNEQTNRWMERSKFNLITTADLSSPEIRVTTEGLPHGRIENIKLSYGGNYAYRETASVIEDLSATVSGTTTVGGNPRLPKNTKPETGTEISRPSRIKWAPDDELVTTISHPVPETSEDDE
ncbi:hypothetical protein I317_06487 [Kwoniella heveanensis CBS 569]|nr:hypothetical protein I317_06487 [Kwoniella heveanensis CBS 569]